jgi:hypothetical protein
MAGTKMSGTILKLSAIPQAMPAAKSRRPPSTRKTESMTKKIIRGSVLPW